ncbi:pyridoxamine 5'-phosphate oxidase family protein [Candidatus Pacearchaeota archaeon]|nr:pyridoxamine 5'-phosphate oxidase family protein [Candidatus Pacearchaeota archaeon]
MIEINDGIKNMIEENAMGLATTDKKGNPHNIAVGYVKVVSKDEIIISNNYINETIENIKQNKNVSLVVWHTNWKKTCIGYELKGQAQYFTEGKWVDFIKKLPINQGEPCKGAILIKINKIKSLVE